MASDVRIPGKYRLRVKQRLAVVRCVEIHGIKPAGRYFGLSRVTVRRWWRGWQREGELGLVPRPQAIELLRELVGRHVVLRSPHRDTRAGVDGVLAKR
jgi:hypothetical protein